VADDIKRKFGIQRKRNYLNRDFGDFRSDLTRYANIYFKDKMQDFSEASLGGLFLDMAAYVGDNMSFYLDHQFNELRPDTAVESSNIESMVRNAGIKIQGDAPASATVDFYIEIPAKKNDTTGEQEVDETLIPKIKDGAKIATASGVMFNLTSTLDFSLRADNGNYVAEVTPIANSAGIVSSFVMMLSAICVSGEITTQNSSIGTGFVPFRTVSISNPHVSTILRVYDSDGNDYHEVESLAQDVVFKKNKLSNGDSSIEVLASPYRYMAETAIDDRTTTLRFGSGNGADIREAKVPDPSDMALPLYGKETFSAFSLDPNKLLRSPSLGVSPSNTTLTMIYRHGGGAHHNVKPNTIKQITEVSWEFLRDASYDKTQAIKTSLACANPAAATGGARAPTLTELKGFITNFRTMQNRIVTVDDLLARIYTLPTEFGVVSRANVLPNPENALSSLLYVVSRDSSGRLTQCSDALKRNLSTYLNEFRLIGDAMDILDATILNFQIKITCRFSHTANKYELVSKVINEVKSIFSRESIALGKPIVKSDIVNKVINQAGVISCVSVELINLSNIVADRTYSTTTKNLSLQLKDDIYFAEPYEIYELRYPQNDIVITVL
jgi:hypothetical protein